MPERTAYIKEVESLLSAYDKEIEKVRAKMAASEEPSRVRSIEQDLVAMRQEIKNQLDLVKRADTSNWKDLRLGVDNAREKLTMNLANAMEEFGEDSRNR